MARFSIAMKKRRKAMVGSFHNQVEAVNTSFNRRHTQSSLGLARTVSSGLSISLGGMMCYIALHYIPAFVQPQKILSATTIDTSVKRLENKGPIRKIFGPYIDAFSMQRTYLRPNQKIEAQFILPEGAKLNLNIQQCQRILVLEIFNCRVISQKNLTVTKETLGYRAFQFENDGFYHFSHKVTLPKDSPKDYTVLWSRL